MAAWTSGFCSAGNDNASHSRCLDHPRADGVPCSCDCHLVDAEILDTPTGALVTDAPPETDDWFAARRGGITGTDLPKILGLTKYGNALSVWLDKRGELTDDAGEAARWGQILEDPVALEWAERNDSLVAPVGVLRHVDEPWMRASLDRTVIACPDGDGTCGLEIKTRSAFKAADWRDGFPDDVLAQVAWGRMVSGFDHMHVAALIGGQRLESYRYDRDEVLEQYLLDAARPVWQSVLEGTPPDVHPDAEGVLLDLLDRLYSQRDGAVELDPETARPWLDQYAEGLDLERHAKAIKTEAKTALVQMLDAGAVGLVDEVPAFTYQRPAASTALTAAEHRRLKKEKPDVWQQLVDDGFITTTNPGPRFDLKKTAASKENAA